MYANCMQIFSTMKTEEKNRAAVAAIVDDSRYPLKNGRITLKLRITHNRTQRYYPLILEPKDKDKDSIADIQKVSKEFGIAKGRSIALLPGDVKQVMKQNPSKDIHVTLKTILESYRERASDVISAMKIFSFDTFVTHYFSKVSDGNDLFEILASTADEFRKDGKISTAGTYDCTINSLKKFSGKEKLPFAAITVSFLKDYEKWFLTPRIIKINPKGKKKGKEKEQEKEQEKIKQNSRTTVSIYLRNVRTVFNKVKPEGVEYPFGKSKNGLYAVPKGRNTKKALTQADVAKIAKFDTIKGTFEQRSRDYWLFSYLCNGINIKDLARLKYSNIDGDKITLIRAKTADTVEEQSTISIPVTPNISRIIDRWGSKPALPDQYVFDILKDKMSPEDEYRAIRQAVQTINKNMTRICAELKIDRATTYTARHSFATVLKRSGASVEFISESLGHKSKQTTMNYLANFEDEEKKKWANMLLPETEL